MRFADKAIWRLGQEAAFEGCAGGQPGGVVWGQWHAVGGIASGPPAVGTSMHDGASVVFVRQADKQLYHKSQRPGHNGTTFEPDFQLLRGAFAAGPELVQKASGLLEVLVLVLGLVLGLGLGLGLGLVDEVVVVAAAVLVLVVIAGLFAPPPPPPPPPPGTHAGRRPTGLPLGTDGAWRLPRLRLIQCARRPHATVCVLAAPRP